jgi:hypothetical protein
MIARYEAETILAGHLDVERIEVTRGEPER